MAKLTVKDLDLEGKKVLVRVDYNVPLSKNNEIENDSRIQASLPTLDYILDQGAAAILFSHLGRVKTEEDKEGRSLQPVATYLEELGYDIQFIDQTRGDELEAAAKNLQAGQLLLVENTRFEDIDGKKESKNDSELAEYWSQLGDVFINDAFGTTHREHASNVGLSQQADQAALGLLVAEEFETISQSISQPAQPFVVVLGGAKVSDKLPVIKNLIEQADQLIIGGGMAYTFLKAQGQTIGQSLLEEDLLDDAKALLEKYGDKIILPTDHVVAPSLDQVDQAEVCESIPDSMMGVDIGPGSIEKFSAIIQDAQTIIWNGPMGVFEVDEFAKGTRAIAQAIGDNPHAQSIVGGGDSVAAVESLGYADAFSHISTGGGAMLELLAGTDLPALIAIDDLN